MRPFVSKRYLTMGLYVLRDTETGLDVPRCWRDTEWHPAAQCTEPAGQNRLGLCDRHYADLGVNRPRAMDRFEG